LNLIKKVVLKTIMKLRTKFSLAAVMLVVLVIVSVAVVLFIFESKMLKQEIMSSYERQAVSLAEVAKESVVINDELVILNYLKLLKRSSNETSYAMFVSKTGYVIAHTDVNQLGSTLNDELWNKILTSNKIQKNLWVYNNQKIVEFSLPVMLKNEKVGYVRLGLLEDAINKNIQQNLNKTRDRILLVSVFAVFLGILGSLILAQTMTKPIKKLAEGAIKIGEGKLDTVIEVKGKDELAGLAKEFNQMAQKLKELDRMKEDFMSSVTHELRSPLTAIKGYINLMLEGRAGPLTDRQKEFLTIVSNNTARLRRFINDILDLAKIEAA
jgi:HAMP domain-containing protein